LQEKPPEGKNVGLDGESTGENGWFKLTGGEGGFSGRNERKERHRDGGKAAEQQGMMTETKGKLKT